MTRLGIVIAVGFVVFAVSFTSLATCLKPTPLKGAATCATTIKVHLNELPDPLVQLTNILLKTEKALENASENLDSTPQDLDQARTDLVDASDNLDTVAPTLFPFIESIITDLKSDDDALRTDTHALPIPKRLQNQILRTLATLDNLADRVQSASTKVEDELSRTGKGVLDAIDAALTALNLGEDEDALAATTLARRLLNNAINDTELILRKFVGPMFKAPAKIESILKISTNRRSLSAESALGSMEPVHVQVLTLQGHTVLEFTASANDAAWRLNAAVTRALANGLYLVVLSEHGRSKLMKLIVAR